jgi:hypothetical protein
MDIFDEDLLRFWKSLSDNNVKYIVTGDFAGAIHANLGFTNVIEIWISDTNENQDKLSIILLELGNERTDKKGLKFGHGSVDFSIGGGMKLDVATNIKGIEGFSFDKCLELATIADIEGIKVPFLHINHLIANKKAVNRPKDQLDVIELEKIKQLRKEMGLIKSSNKFLPGILPIYPCNPIFAANFG